MMRRRTLTTTISVLFLFASSAGVGCSDQLGGGWIPGDDSNESDQSWEVEAEANDDETTERETDDDSTNADPPDVDDDPEAPDDEPTDPADDEDDDGDDEFVAHEWGTFTSVVDSDGTYLPGLHHEGVALPAFVHEFRHSGIQPPSDMPRDLNPDARGVYLPEPVTQKLETPVIYFYSDRPRDVRVEVDFPKGYITKWYPDAVEQQPRQPDCPQYGVCDGIDRAGLGLESVADGRMSWEVSITHQDRSDAMVDVPPEDIWAPSREVPEAAFVDHDGETDKFIFYRGLGKFAPPFTVEARRGDGQPEFTFSNESDRVIGDVYLMKIGADRGRIVELGALRGGESKSHRPAPKEMPKEKFVEHAKQIVEDGLVDTGLTRTESEAMVETWAHSYFRAEGYRVLYTVPRAWTDRILPIDIDPKPDELVRTLVGRVEVMTPSVEQETLDRVRRAYSNDRSLERIYRGGRFEEPHFRRACQLAEADELKSWCETELAKLAAEAISEDGRSGY